VKGDLRPLKELMSRVAQQPARGAAQIDGGQVTSSDRNWRKATQYSEYIISNGVQFV